MVIILTLFVQGLTLPGIIKRIGFFNNRTESEGDKEKKLKRDLTQHSIQFMEQNLGEKYSHNPFYKSMLQKWKDKLNSPDDFYTEDTKGAYLKLLEEQRKFLIEKNADPNLDEDILRRQIHLIDLEEERVRTAVG